MTRTGREPSRLKVHFYLQVRKIIAALIHHGHNH